METPKLQLKELKITYNTYGDHQGKFTGSITYRDNDWKNSFELYLDPDTTRRFMELIADQVVASTMELGQKVAAQVLQAIEENTPKSE